MIDNGLVPWTHKELLHLAQAALTAPPEEAADLILLIWNTADKKQGDPDHEMYLKLVKTLKHTCVGLN